MRTPLKTKNDFLKKLEKRKWAQKSPAADAAPATPIVPPPDNIFSCFQLNRSSYQNSPQNKKLFSQKVGEKKVGSKVTCS